nr:MAG TPA: hypothetical protein [Caudoviricetes sp.]
MNSHTDTITEKQQYYYIRERQVLSIRFHTFSLTGLHIFFTKIPNFRHIYSVI